MKNRNTNESASAREHLMDYVLDLHIIIGANGMCRCGEDGITCSERLRRLSNEIGSALLGAHMVKDNGGQKWTPNDKLCDGLGGHSQQRMVRAQNP